MLKRFWFQVHWLLGISAGLVLAVMGATGGLYAFADDILGLLNPAITQVSAAGGAALPPAELLARIKLNRPYVSSLSLSGSATDAARLGFMLPVAGSEQKKFELQYVNPYTGQLLGKPRGEDFFRFVLDLHRKLALGDTGKAVTGASALVLVFMCLSGLYLRWPKKNAWHWRLWLTLDAKRSGRGWLSELHAVSATWLLLMLLLAALTGLYWSYGWYRGWVGNLAAPAPYKQVQGVPKTAVGNASAAGAPAEPNLAAVWQTFRTEVADYRKLIMLLPSRPGQAVQILYVDSQAPHRYANSKLLLDAQTGAIQKHEHYTEQAAGARLLASVYALHSGSYWGVAGMLMMMLASLALPGFAVTGWLMYLARRKEKSRTSMPS
ncbi:MAG: PepSY-associated TM helix domain-containing protein [Pseudomonadota bacterium]